MADLAVTAMGLSPQVEVLPIETRREGNSYTIDTVEELTKMYPGNNFTLVLGSDAANNLSKWHRSDELLKMVAVLVVKRPGAKPSDYDEIPIKALDIDSRVFFHWKEKGIIDYDPYKEEFENTSKTSDKKVKKWVQLNAFDMLWLLIVKELRKFNMDLETIKELKEYLNTQTYTIGEDSFNQFSEEDIQKNIKTLMPAALEDEVMKTILEGVTAKKLDDFLGLIDDEIQPYFTPIGTAFLSVLLNQTNPILMIKNKIEPKFVARFTILA
mgnify:CR=1 FL=1